MIEPERRWYACSLKVEVLLPDGGAGRRLGEGALINVSPAGGVLSFPGPLRQGVRYTLKLTKPAVAVLPCRVWREVYASEEKSAPRCFCLVFDLSPEQAEVFAVALSILAGRDPPEAGHGRPRS